MVELKEKAGSYAEENVLNVLKEAFAKVYADGYRDGYNDCKEEIPVDLRLNKTEFIDLGLPSGTLWATDYCRDERENIQYYPYEIASRSVIPTKEQWEELIGCCKWEYDIEYNSMNEVRCIGPNGNYLKFSKTGMKGAEKLVRGSGAKALFWIFNDKEPRSNKENEFMIAAQIYYIYKPYSPEVIKEMDKVFSGYKLPIRLVRKQ